MNYLTVDISNLYADEGRSSNHYIKINPDNYEKAFQWCMEQFGEFGEHTWWPAPYLLKNNDKRGSLIQAYEFAFTNNDHALQFKLMGF